MIKTENLSFEYESGTEPVIGDISLEIEEGEYVAVIGANGCGKTTLIRHFNGLLIPVEGKVLVDGLGTRDTAALRTIRQRVGMVFQNPDNQIVGMSVEEDVAFGPGNLGLPPHKIRERVTEALARVGLEKHLERAPHTLSSGEKQLLAIAGALAMKPRYIVLDEPTAYLAPVMRTKILEVLKGLHERGMTIIHVTHDMDEIVDAKRVLVMGAGRIQLDKSPAEVFCQVDLLRQLGLGVPKVAELMWRLRQGGLEVRDDVLTIDEACTQILSLIRNCKKMEK